MAVLLYFAIFSLILFISALIFFKRKYSFWRNRNIPYIEPHILFGTSGNPFTRKLALPFVTQQHYLYLKSQGHKWGGLFNYLSPTLLILDIDLIKSILLKDFQYFTDRGIFYDEKADPLTGHLFNLKGNKWRHLRSKLTSTFTSGKIKMMFPMLIACGGPMIDSINEFVRKKEPIDIKEIAACFTTDVIGSCAFGLECNSFKAPESDFRKYGKTVLSVTSTLDVLRMLLVFVAPQLAFRCGITRINREPKKFFREVVRSTVAYRRTNNVVRNDFIQLLMNLENEFGRGEGLTMDEITAQAFLFWFAGFETSSTAMSFCLFELALNQHIQAKAREEIGAIKGELNYENVMEMTYLNQVVEEALRKYPPGTGLLRMAVLNYKAPGTNIVIEKGTQVLIPVYALHHDAEYFPDPEKFDPSRFNDANKGKIRPFTYLPFGEGPRNCIGLRFGVLQAKVGLAILLKNFKFAVNRNTKVPLEYNRFSIILNSENSIWLDVERISQ